MCGGEGQREGPLGRARGVVRRLHSSLRHGGQLGIEKYCQYFVVFSPDILKPDNKVFNL